MEKRGGQSRRVIDARHARIMGPTIADGRLSHGAFRLYALLCYVANPAAEETSWYGQSRLAEILDTSARTIRDWEAELEKAGLIQIESRRLEGLTNVIRLVDECDVYGKEKCFGFLKELGEGGRKPASDPPEAGFRGDGKPASHESSVREGSERKAVEGGRENAPTETPGESSGGPDRGSAMVPVAPAITCSTPEPTAPPTPAWAALGGDKNVGPNRKVGSPLLTFDEALAGGRRPSNGTHPKKDRAQVAKPYRGSPALEVLQHMAKCVAERFQGAPMLKPGAKELALVSSIIGDVGKEVALKMVACLVYDWNAAREKWRFRDTVPDVAILWMKKNDLAAAVTSGDGIVTEIHRRSEWAAVEKGETVPSGGDIWK